jgi:hypothetical protein
VIVAVVMVVRPGAMMMVAALKCAMATICAAFRLERP